MPGLRRVSFVALAILPMVVACGGVSIDLPEEIGSDFDFDGVIEDLRDCDTLSDAFVAVVREAADDLDRLAEGSGGRVPAGELAGKVDVIVDNAYFEVAERLGCNAVSQRIETIDRLRDLSPDSAAGEDLVDEVIRELEEQAG
jgi:uncharacterized protein YunC (DUF1805 family)